MDSSPRIVFMGSPDFAVPTLEALCSRYSLIGVVTQPDRPKGRGGTLTPPAVKKCATGHNLPVIQPEKLKDPIVMEQLHEWDPDLIVVAAFGQILRKEVLNLPEFGCLNVHASLLPRWRGAAPIQAAIMAGDHETGISIMKMDPGVDTGPILAQWAVPVTENDTSASLFTKLAPLGAELLMDVLPRYLSGNLIPQPQPERGVTHAPTLKKEDGCLDFSFPAVDLERRIRAMFPWPGAYINWEKANLKILRAHIAPASSPGDVLPGTRLVFDGLPSIIAGDDSVLILDEVQPAGKKPMTGKAFLSGARHWLG